MALGHVMLLECSDETRLRQFQAPRDIVNPLLWLFNKQQRDPSDAERLLCDCALLSILHDEGGRLTKLDKKIYRHETYTGKYFQRNQFCEALWYDVLIEPKNDQLIQFAFETVKAYLTSEKPAGTEQKGTFAKPEKESWLWKVYEKTLKVIVDSVLDRIWPKPM